VKLVDFTKQVLNQHRIRIIGVCFGHQIVGRAMGVKVDRSDRGWEVAVTSVNLTDKGRQLFKKDVLVWLMSNPTPEENPFPPPLVLHSTYS